MTLGDVWGPRLARAVAPEEEELSAIYVDAFIEGGRQRSELFAPAAGEAGGFTSGESLSIIAPVLYAISVTAPLLNYALVSQQFTNLASLLNSATNVASFRRLRRDVMGQDTSDRVEPGSERSASASGSPTSHPEVLRTVIDSMERELKHQGMSEEQSSLVTLKVIRELLQEPDESLELVNALSAEEAT